MRFALQGLGEWRSLLAPHYPDVACFVDDTWPATEREAAGHYLSQGRPLHYWMGMEACLLGCAQPLPTTGCTDGTYYWPASLLHYLTHHAVRLPDEFMQHLNQLSDFPAQAAAAVEDTTPVEYQWWQAQAGWQPGASSLCHLSPQQVQNFLRNYERQQLADHPATTQPEALARLVAELRNRP